MQAELLRLSKDPECQRRARVHDALAAAIEKRSAKYMAGQTGPLTERTKGLLRARDAEWNEGDHPRGQPGNPGQFSKGGGGAKKAEKKSPQLALPLAGGKERQQLRMPQFGLTPTPTTPHQKGAGIPEGAEYFLKNWHKSGSVGGHSQPTPEQVKKYTEAYESLVKQTKKAEPEAKPAVTQKPLELSKMKKVGGKLGTNEGGTYEDAKGKKFYVKIGKSPAHVKNELIAGSLYNLAGAKTLHYVPVEGGKHIGTEWQHKDKDNAKSFSAAELEKAREDFAVHAWTANWDAAGLDYDNLAIIEGKPTSVDLGGALDWRALGEPKGAHFGNSVGEWDTLRDPGRNKQNAQIFGGMSKAELRKSAEKVTSIPDSAIKAAILAGGGNSALIDKMIARKHDLAKRAGVKAKDEWQESQHPRGQPGNAGQFASSPGGGAEGGEKKEFKNKKEHAGHLLEQGVTMQEMLKALGWPSISMPAMAASHGMKLEKFKENGQTKYKGTKMSPAELAQFKANAAAEKMAKIAEKKALGGKEINEQTIKEMKEAQEAEEAGKTLAQLQKHIETEPTKKNEAYWQEKAAQGAAALKAAQEKAPYPKPSDFPPPTQAELEKAKKSMALQPQYLGIPDLPQTPAVLAAIKEFNDKYAGKSLASPAALEMKVNDFKTLKAKVTGMLSAEKQKQIAAQQEAQKKQIEQQKAQAAAQQAAEQAQKLALKAQHAEVIKELGITEEHELQAFDAFIEHFGGAKTAIQKMKQYESEAKKQAAKYPGMGYEKLSGFEMGCIRHYTGSSSGWINEAILSDFASQAQHMFEHVLNKALDKLPKVSGKTVKRGLTLKKDLQQQLFAMGTAMPGKQIWTHRNFASSSKGTGFSGNTKLHIEATGKNGADVQAIGSMGEGSSEAEVLFRSNLKLLINKSEYIGSVLHVYCKEM